MLRSDYDEQICSIARALEVVGERWTLLILRDAFSGLTRFGEFEQSLGLSKQVLRARLKRLVDEGVLERRRYQERPERFEYVLSAKGAGLWKVLFLLMLWGDEHYLHPDGRTRVVQHRACGGSADDRLHCTRCGAELELGDLELALGPALVAAAERSGERYPWRRAA